MIINKHQYYLDGIRGLSVIYVIAFHIDPSKIPGGFVGVDMFFVVSGYIITYLLISEEENKGDIDVVAFYKRRSLRILPAMYFLCLVILLASKFYVPETYYQTWNDFPYGVLFFLNWHYIFGNHSYFMAIYSPPLLQHLWSLSVEFQFYFFWPLLIKLIKSNNNKTKIMLLAAIVVASYVYMGINFNPENQSKTYLNTVARIGAFVVGGIFAFFLQKKMIKWSNGCAVVVSYTSTFMVIAYPFLCDNSSSFLYYGGFFGGALLTSLLIISSNIMMENGRRNFILENGMLVGIGVISYSLYLWHWPIVNIVNEFLGVDVYWKKNALILVFVTSTALASYFFVEKPLRKIESYKLILSSTRLSVNRFLFLCVMAFVFFIINNRYSISKNAFFFDKFQDVNFGKQVNSNNGFSNEAVSFTCFDAKDFFCNYKKSLGSLNSKQDLFVNYKFAIFDAKLTGIKYFEPENKQFFDKRSQLNINTNKNEDLITKREIKKNLGFFFKRDDIKYDHQENGYVSRVYEDNNLARRRSFYAIGDSVMLGGSGALLRRLQCLNVDAKVGRSLVDLIRVVNNIEDRGLAPDAYIIHIGNNDIFGSNHIELLRRLLRNVNKVFLVNLKIPRSYELNNNKILKEFSEANSEEVTLIDWKNISSSLNNPFGKDKMHLSQDGAEYYAEIIEQIVFQQINCSER